MSPVPWRPPPRALRISLGVGGAGILLTGLGVWLDPGRALVSYCFAFAVWFSFGAGALLALLAFHATGTQWISPLRRIVELLALSSILTVIAVLPLLIFMRRLYPWSVPGFFDSEPEKVLTFRAFYLQPWFFLLRSAVYMVLLAVGPWLLFRRSLANREGRVLGSALMPATFFAATFACYDWLMSLTPAWWSEIYGLYVLTGGFVAAFATLVVLSIGAHQRKLVADVEVRPHFFNLGKLLFGFVCFWGYIAYDQYLLIWIADKPHESSFYLIRSQHGWRAVFIALLLARFLVPFFALLSRPAKLHLGFLRAVCFELIAAHVFDMYWLVIPVSGERVPRWTDAAALVGVSGFYLAFLFWMFARTPLATKPALGVVATEAVPVEA
ncbi:MAG: hypothetical protein JST54_00270 [Deltaproteobacteria bacterium]|nr:hypothetical protein [Deltaproteobacteria bacterium]